MGLSKAAAEALGMAALEDLVLMIQDVSWALSDLFHEPQTYCHARWKIWPRWKWWT